MCANSPSLQVQQVTTPLDTCRAAVRRVNTKLEQIHHHERKGATNGRRHSMDKKQMVHVHAQVTPKVRELRKALHRRHITTGQLFSMMDADRSDTITFTEFKRGVAMAGVCCTSEPPCPCTLASCGCTCLPTPLVCDAGAAPAERHRDARPVRVVRCERRWQPQLPRGLSLCM